MKLSFSSASLLLPGLLMACASDDRGAAPPLFGGQGAVITKEQPLPPAGTDAADSGPCQKVSPPGETALFDDFEDGDNKPFHGFEREGWWWAATDPTPGATLAPPVGVFAAERLPATEATRGNVFAAHFMADGQKEWGAVWGSTLNWSNNGIRCPYNASAFAGVKLRAKGKGKGTVRVTFGLPGTIPGENGGRCKERCYDDYGKVLFLTESWQEYELPWDRLQQEGWGTQVRFEPERLIQLGFKVDVKSVPADFWIDDVAFMPKAGAVAKAP